MYNPHMIFLINLGRSPFGPFDHAILKINIHPI